MNYLQHAEKALEYLQESEADYAAMKAQHQSDKERTKITLAQQEIVSEMVTEAARRRDATASEAYREAIDQWSDSMEAFYEIDAKRKRAELTIEMYRSVNAAMKKGNMI